jgi:hypothetical protein
LADDAELLASMLMPAPDAAQSAQPAQPAGEQEPPPDETAAQQETPDTAAQSADEGQQDDATPTDDTPDEGAETREGPELTDDLRVSVKVDGEIREVTLADLKKAYAGEGAIEKRLQQATELRKQIESERQQAQKEIETSRANLVQAFAAFDQMLFQPKLAPPDPALAQTNPTQYLLMKDQYQAEQQALNTRRQQVQEVLSRYQAEQAAKASEAAAIEAQRLLEAIPALRDPQKAPEIRDLFLEGARAYGFSDAELGAVTDHRMLVVLADAAKWRRMKAQAGKAPPPKAAVKPMAAGAASQAKVGAPGRAQAAAMQRARQTGRPEDVALTMLVQQPRK